MPCADALWDSEEKQPKKIGKRRDGEEQSRSAFGTIPNQRTSGFQVAVSHLTSEGKCPQVGANAVQQSQESGKRDRRDSDRGGSRGRNNGRGGRSVSLSIVLDRGSSSHADRTTPHDLLTHPTIRLNKFFGYSVSLIPRYLSSLLRYSRTTVPAMSARRFSTSWTFT